MLLYLFQTWNSTKTSCAYKQHNLQFILNDKRSSTNTHTYTRKLTHTNTYVTEVSDKQMCCTTKCNPIFRKVCRFLCKVWCTYYNSDIYPFQKLKMFVLNRLRNHIIFVGILLYQFLTRLLMYVNYSFMQQLRDRTYIMQSNIIISSEIS